MKPALHQASASTLLASGRLRVATYNIHKGVRGVGPRRRLEIHNMVLGIEALDADLVFLQEVRSMNRKAARHFPDTKIGWPKEPQADYLAPEGYEVAYRTNAVTKDGEHGNALLSRWPIGEVGHHDVSDHRFEQRGLLHVPVTWNDTAVHAIVAHFGLIHASRDWGERLDVLMHACSLELAIVEGDAASRRHTFPSRLPFFSMDRIYARGFRCVATSVPRGPVWARMSDHLPLVAELELA